MRVWCVIFAGCCSDYLTHAYKLKSYAIHF